MVPGSSKLFLPVVKWFLAAVFSMPRIRLVARLPLLTIPADQWQGKCPVTGEMSSDLENVQWLGKCPVTGEMFSDWWYVQLQGKCPVTVEMCSPYNWWLVKCWKPILWLGKCADHNLWLVKCWKPVLWLAKRRKPVLWQLRCWKPVKCPLSHDWWDEPVYWCWIIVCLFKDRWNVECLFSVQCLMKYWKPI